MRTPLVVAASLFAFAFAASAQSADPERDFSGKWVLDRAASDTRDLGPAESTLTVSQSDAGILCTAGTSQWSYALDGSETRKRIGEESRNAVIKWEGAALLVNTLVSGPQDYTIMDRWRLSRDRNTLTIRRQIVRRGGEAEGELVFRREGVAVAGGPGTLERRSAPLRQLAQEAPRTAEPAAPSSSQTAAYKVPAGTRILLQLISEINTKRAAEGDRVYLRTAVPVAAGGRVVIPRGSDVQGVITRAKPAGRVSGKPELFIRFQSITLPNGITRDFSSRPPGEEGQAPGEGKGADPNTVLLGTGVGASIGGLASGLPGAAAGGGIGALAGVLLSRDRNVILRQGTNIEMMLDRDLVFYPDEIPGGAGY